jgi:hypothetical protein
VAEVISVGDPIGQLIKWVFIVALLPGLAMAAVSILWQVLGLLLPILILFVVIISVVSGVSAGLTMRRRAGNEESPDDMPYPPPEPIHRPRGPRRDG